VKEKIVRVCEEMGPEHPREIVAKRGREG